MSSPKKGVAYTFYLSLIDALDSGSYKVDPTIVAGDFQVSTDGGALVNLATLPTVDPAGSIFVLVSLSAAEMSGDKITVQGVDAAGDEWSDVMIFIDATTNNVDDIATPAQVNAEVLDVMDIDTITLPGQIAPPLAPTHRQAIAWLYKAFRNRKTQTATQWFLMADDESTVDAKATVSDDATTAIKQEIVTGP